MQPDIKKTCVYASAPIGVTDIVSGRNIKKKNTQKNTYTFKARDTPS